MFNTQNWALILSKASSNSLHSASVDSHSVNLTLFFPPVWENYGHHFCLPRCRLKSLTFHLSLGAHSTPLPHRTLSPFPLLGPRCVTYEKAQGPGPLLQSHSGSLCFVHSALVAPGGSAEFWRTESAQSDILPSSQELTCQWPTAFPQDGIRETQEAGFLSTLYHAE